MPGKAEPVSHIAIFPWGDVIETFLDPLNLDISGFANEMTGGWLFGYVEALAAAGIRTTIIAPSERVRSTVTMRHRDTGADIVYVPGQRVQSQAPNLTALKRWLSEPIKPFKHEILQRRIDCLLCQEYEDPRFDRLIGLGRQLGLPVFASFQGGDRTNSIIERLVRGSRLRRASGLIIASRDERKRLIEQCGTALPPIAAIPNPLRVSLWSGQDKDRAREKLELPADARIAICHGRVDIWRKGLDILVAAWEEVIHGPLDRLIVIGTGADHAAFAQLLGDRRPTGVQWISQYQTDRGEMRRWLSAADLYVSASRVEGMPVAPLEAMACGLPVVATDAQGMADIVTGGTEACGLIVPRGDAHALARGIEALFRNNALREQMAHAARCRVTAHFSIERVGASLQRFLNRPETQKADLHSPGDQPI